MATIKNLSKYLLTITYFDEKNMVRHVSLEPGKETGELSDEQAEKWATGPGKGFCKPSSGNAAVCSIKMSDKNNRSFGSSTVKVFIGGKERHVTPEELDVLRSVLGDGDIAMDVAVPTPDDKESTVPAGDDIHEKEGIPNLAGLHWNKAVKMVEECTDPDQLQEWSEIETRSSVLDAINARFEEIVK